MAKLLAPNQEQRQTDRRHGTGGQLLGSTLALVPEVGGGKKKHRYAEWVLSIKVLGASPSTLLLSTSLLIEPSRALSASAFCPGSQLQCEYSHLCSFLTVPYRGVVFLDLSTFCSFSLFFF